MMVQLNVLRWYRLAETITYSAYWNIFITFNLRIPYYIPLCSLININNQTSFNIAYINLDSLKSLIHGNLKNKDMNL